MKSRCFHFTVTALLMLPVDNAGAEPVTTAVDTGAGPATTPAPNHDRWWVDRHADKLAEKANALATGRPIELVFVGDSITHHFNEALWELHFAPYGVLNLGFSGDRTEQVLWRLGLGDAGEENNEIAGLTPKLFVVMIGTNNTGHRQDPAEETAAGIEAIVDRLREVSPESRVLLLAVFPRGATPDDPLRKLNDEINGLVATLGERGYVSFLDINDRFLEEDGVLPESVMPDLLHPNEEGYRRWAEAIQPHVDRLMAAG